MWRQSLHSDVNKLLIERAVSVVGASGQTDLTDVESAVGRSDVTDGQPFPRQLVPTACKVRNCTHHADFSYKQP